MPTPPGGRGHGLARALGSTLQSAARRSSLKPLHWVKVTRAMQGSLWAELQKQVDANRYSQLINHLLAKRYRFSTFLYIYSENCSDDKCHMNLTEIPFFQ
jgi:hypothetical protein